MKCAHNCWEILPIIIDHYMFVMCFIDFYIKFKGNILCDFLILSINHKSYYVYKKYYFQVDCTIHTRHCLTNEIMNAWQMFVFIFYFLIPIKMIFCTYQESCVALVYAKNLLWLDQFCLITTILNLTEFVIIISVMVIEWSVSLHYDVLSEQTMPCYHYPELWALGHLISPRPAGAAGKQSIFIPVI